MPIAQTNGIGKSYVNNINPYNNSNNAKGAGALRTSDAIKNANNPNSYNDPEVRLLKKIGVIECQTCKNRKYQDGSDDPGVSFKTPSHVSPEASASAVMSHELEHVSREQVKAASDGRKVVSQNVQTYTGICLECGRVYTAGGKTTTMTKADDKNDYFMENMKNSLSQYYGKTLDVRV